MCVEAMMGATNEVLGMGQCGEDVHVHLGMRAEGMWWVGQHNAERAKRDAL